MAQADYSIANQGFPATRADINSHLQAIATNNSGTSAPSTQYAGQFWLDTTSSNWVLYIHDGADDIQFATIDTSANTVNFIDSELADGSVTNAKLGADAVDGTKIADDSINSEHYVDGSIDTAHISNDAVDNTKLDLADDYTFTGKISGHNYPAFFAYLDLDQSGINDGSSAKINVDTEVFDTDNCYDNVTNYRFTPNVAGKYLFQAAGVLESSSDSSVVDFATLIFKNGSVAAQSQTNPTANYGRKFTQTLSVVLEANGTTDYFELYSYGDTSDGGTWTAKGQPSSTRYVTYFGALRIGD